MLWLELVGITDVLCVPKNIIHELTDSNEQD